ncbi:MAG TPA: SGNH/GDSL hydrolase family protein [Chloroflexota bacterium]|nr:SGNH/GDSL hydrolase family protein [Chloroflexota bacterium]
MKRGPLLALCSALLAAALLPGAGVGARATTAKGPVLGDFYLALGDSLSVGYQPPIANEKWTHGWVYQFRDLLNTIHPVELQDLAIPGECSFTLIKGGLDPACSTKSVDSPSQLAEAVTFLKTHAGLVNPITVDVGGDDLNSNKAVLLAGTPAQQKQFFGKVFPAMGHNWVVIFQTLRAACSTCEIIAVNQYNPFPAGTVKFDAKALDNEYTHLLQQAAMPFKVRIADVYTPFVGHEVLYTWVSVQDIHPTNIGYTVMAEAVAKASGYPVKMQP